MKNMQIGVQRKMQLFIDDQLHLDLHSFFKNKKLNFCIICNSSH